MKKILAFSIVLAVIQYNAQAQQGMSLKDCIDYAVINQNKLKASYIDEKLQLSKNNQIAASILPQVSLSGSITYFPVVPKNRSRGDLFNFDGLFAAFNQSAFNPNYVAPEKAEYNALQFALPLNSSCTLQVTQILFNSEIFVALQARKTLEDLTKLNTQRTQEELSVNVSKAYYNCLIANKRIALLDENINLLGSFEKNVQGLFKEGFAEKIDADKLTVQRNNLETEREKIKSIIDLGVQLLKFQMGMPLEQGITLTDELNIAELSKNSLVDNQIDYNKRTELQLLRTVKKLNEFDLIRTKKSNLPTVVGIGTAGLGSQMKRFTELVTLPYYPSAMIGISASMGLYDGGRRKHKMDEIKLNLQKNDLDIETFKQAVDLETSAAKTTLNNNLKSLRTQESNLKLAEKVYDISQKKLKEGVGSTIEVLQAQTALKESQTNYIAALYDATISKLDLQKALGELNKN
jgi:outer membrane protein